MSVSTVGIVRFRMFNREYQYNENDIADMLHFSHGEGDACETPLDTEWAHEFGRFGEQLTSNLADSFKRNNATHARNPTIRYFHQILIHSIFGQENNSRINVKELFYIHSVFEPTRVNPTPFMLVHMQAICTAKKDISLLEY